MGQELRFHLTVHNPYRPVRGLLIDIKTRCDSVHNVDYFRPEIEAFLDQVFLTDAPLIFAPSQIALAAIIHAITAKAKSGQLRDWAAVWVSGGRSYTGHHRLSQEDTGDGEKYRRADEKYQRFDGET